MSEEETQEQEEEEREENQNEEESSSELKDELNELKEEVGEPQGEIEEDRDFSAEIMELKRRMDRTEKEMKAVTEALKSTLLDIRTFLTEMDNPFNLLRSMGVDKLVSKAVEQVEEEFNKARREEAKKRAAKTDLKPKEKVIAVQNLPAGATATMTEEATAPVRVPEQPEKKMSVSSESSATPTASQSPATPLPSVSPTPSKTQASLHKSMLSEPTMHPEASRITAVPRKSYMEPVSVERASWMKPTKHGSKLERQLPATDALEVTRPLSESQLKVPFQISSTAFSNEDYYEAYVTLVAGLLFLRLGEKGANEMLSECVRKGWASAKVIGDIIDTIRILKLYKRGANDKARITYLNIDLEDKMLLASLLKKLDKPVIEWREPTHILLLLSLLKTLTWLLSKGEELKKNSRKGS